MGNATALDSVNPA